MHQKRLIPMHFEAQIEERLGEPRRQRWHAQFKIYPLGYFRGKGSCPGMALLKAWGKFRREVDPRERWWTVVAGDSFPRY